MTGNGLDEAVALDGSFFVFGLPFVPRDVDGVLEPFVLRFTDASGADISDQFRQADA